MPAHTGKRRTGLGFRIALVTALVAILTMLVAALVALPLASSSAEQAARSNLDQLSEAAAVVVERAEANPEVLPDRVTQRLTKDNITAFYVQVGEVFPGGIDSELTPAQHEQIARHQVISGEKHVGDGPDLFYAARPLSDGGYLLLTQPVSVASKVAEATLGRFVLALAIGVIIAIAAGSLLAARLSRPLGRAASAATELASGNREVSVPVEGPREIAELAESMNELRDALAMSEGRQRDFLLSVSHELRTPMTAIRGYAEAISDGVLPEQQREVTAATLIRETDRLDRLVADLLELSRLGSADFSITPISMDFAQVARDAAEVWGRRCSAEGLTLSVVTNEHSIPGNSDEIRVRQIMDNLVANALRVTPSGGVIVLEVHVIVDSVVIEVRDSGPGLADEDLNVAFQPAVLYSRYRGVRRVGSGVGLALVGRLAQRLGGTASAGHAPEGGACFTVELARDVSDISNTGSIPPIVPKSADAQDSVRQSPEWPT